MKKLLIMMKVPFVALVKQPRLAAEIAVVVLIALIWFGGEWIGLQAVDARVQAMIGIVAVRAVIYVAHYLLAQKRAEQLESSLRQSAQRGRADKREEIEAVRIQFEKGIDALKGSRLARGLSGKAALYALPWYMFIGPSASGKSTVLRHSGLEFSWLGGSGKGLQGLGGTRNCDWWFTNAGVLLDTAGRYVTQADDQEEWLAFLDLLRKYRGKKPLNGVIATISLADVLQGSEEDLVAHAKQIRARIDELIKRLGVVFPVYVMFTKCDLVQGFVEFFEELSRAERERTWGCTLPRGGAGNESLGARFAGEFTHLVSVLYERRLARIATARGSQKVSIFGFPMQMAATRDRLTRFVETLFHSNAYQDNPLFRGFYFTSGTQEGSPIDRILGEVGRVAGLAPAHFAAGSPTEVKSYFLKELFSDIIFPDQNLVAPSAAMYRQRGHLRVATFALSLVLGCAAIVGLTISYLGNRQLLGGIESAAFPPHQLGWTSAQFPQNVESLAELGERLKELVEIEQRGQVPLHLTGLYRGGRLRGVVGEVYGEYFARLFFPQMKQDIEDRLRQPVRASDEGSISLEEYEKTYSYLKAYLMLGESPYLKPTYLQEWLSEYWSRTLSRLYPQDERQPDLQTHVLDQMALYSRHLAQENKHRLHLDTRLVERAQEQLAHVRLAERIYALSRHKADSVMKPFGLDQILQGSHQGSLTSAYPVPGVYTVAGWNGPFQAAVEDVVKELKDESWVIGEPPIEHEQLDKDIKLLYFQDYVRHWREFLRSLRIKAVITPADVDEELGFLGSDDSPLQRIFQTVADNTVPRVSGIATSQNGVTGFVDKAKQYVGIQRTDEAAAASRKGAAAPTDFSRFVSSHFNGLRQLLESPSESKEEAPLVRYLADLKKTHQTVRSILRAESPPEDMKALARSIVAGEQNDLTQARKTTEVMLLRVDQEVRSTIEELLSEPWSIAMQGVLDRAKAEVSKKWEADVYPVCQRIVDRSYPFRQVGGEASMAEVSTLFHPMDGVLWQFYQTELKTFVTEGSAGWASKQRFGVQMRLSDDFLNSLLHARMVSDSLFSRGAVNPGFAFSVFPHRVEGNAKDVNNITEVRLEVGGQVFGYQNGLRSWKDLTWPGPAPTAGALLQVLANDGSVPPKEYRDWWGLFRLMDTGRLSPLPGTNTYRIAWELPASEGRTVKAQYDLRLTGHSNPFRPGFFEQFRCVEHL